MSFWDIFKQQPQTTIRITHEVSPTEDSEHPSKASSGTIFERDVPTVEDRIKTASPSANGLYPHEILLLAYAQSQRVKYIKSSATDFPGFWWYQYGVKDVGATLKSLVDRRFLELADDGVTYRLTAKGDTELNSNGYVYYIHRFSNDNDMTPWYFNAMQSTVPDRIKNYPWKDKYWWWLNQQQATHMTDGQTGLARNTILTMAQFRAYESNYNDALSLLDRVISLDKASGDFSEFKGGTPPGLIQLKAKWQKKLEK